MPGRMILHDRRLAGNPPQAAPNIYQVDGNVSIQHCVGWVATYARSRSGLTELDILCHGWFGNTDDERTQMCWTEDASLGFGLQLCREGLTLANVSLTAAWSRLIHRVSLYSCGPANTRPGAAGTEGDGRRFCGELALWSGAEVIAAVHTQWYNRNRTFWERLAGANQAGTIDFGAWEGEVYRFDPQTGQPHAFAAAS